MYSPTGNGHLASKQQVKLRCTQVHPAHIGQGETLGDELRPASPSGHPPSKLTARHLAAHAAQGVRPLLSIAIGTAMHFRLTVEQCLMLELIADGPLLAIPEIDPYTAVLAATKLIALSDHTTWTITKLGEAMLERQHCPLH
jgi:hypothetical protein